MKIINILLIFSKFQYILSKNIKEKNNIEVITQIILILQESAY